jgi:hypothetical protein
MQEAVEKMTKYIDNESKLSDFNGFNAKDVSFRLYWILDFFELFLAHFYCCK